MRVSYNDYLELTTEFTSYNYEPLIECVEPTYIVAIVPVNAEVDLYNYRVRVFSEGIRKCHGDANIILLKDGKSNISWNGDHDFGHIDDVVRFYGHGNRKGVCIYSKGNSLAVGDEFVYDYDLTNTWTTSPILCTISDLTFGLPPVGATTTHTVTTITRQDILNAHQDIFDAYADAIYLINEHGSS